MSDHTDDAKVMERTNGKLVQLFDNILTVLVGFDILNHLDEDLVEPYERLSAYSAWQGEHETHC